MYQGNLTLTLVTLFLAAIEQAPGSWIQYPACALTWSVVVVYTNSDVGIIHSHSIIFRSDADREVLVVFFLLIINNADVDTLPVRVATEVRIISKVAIRSEGQIGI